MGEQYVTDKQAFEIVSKWLADPITKTMRDAIKFEDNLNHHPAMPENMMFVVLGVMIREELRRVADLPKDMKVT